MSELQDFVLAFYQLNGAIVDPPHYGVHEVLLPDPLAKELDVPVLQEIVFGKMGPEDGDPSKLYLTQGHPVVERLVANARRTAAPAQAYINSVRPTKHGLDELARQAFSFANARLSRVRGREERAAQFHYVVFTFKVTLTTDEKQELLADVAMDAQAGYAVDWQQIRAQGPLDQEAAFGHLVTAPARWIGEDNPLSPTALEGLLERAQGAVLGQMADVITRIRRRSVRYLDLDRARLEGYYGGMEDDLQRRLQRAVGDRRPPLEDKIVAVQAERAQKLSDAEARYRLRADLQLVTAQVIAQPKVLLLVEIQNRSTIIQRRVVWDPLLHRIEPLRCDACGLPGLRFHLCSGGHLVHAECLLERQCVDCKRVYCRLCEEKILACVVCGRPVCESSLITCRECGRGTCGEHKDLCHADDGEPMAV